MRLEAITNYLFEYRCRKKCVPPCLKSCTRWIKRKLLSLLAKSGETEPITDAIEHHADLNVRLSAVRLLGLAGGTEAVGRLRQLAVRDHVPEKVRSAVLEVVYKMDQAQVALADLPLPTNRAVHRRYRTSPRN